MGEVFGMEEMFNQLLQQIEAEPDRKSIKSDIDVLKDYFSMEELGQLNVIRNPDNKNDVQFSLTVRPFEMSDLKQLMNCLQTARYLSAMQGMAEK